MAIFTKTTPTATPTGRPTGGKATDLTALRQRHAAIEIELSVLAEATADSRAAVQRLKAEHSAAQAAAQKAQREYAAALAHRAVSKTAKGAPEAPGQALAHAQGLSAAIDIAEGMVATAEAAEAPVRSRLAEAKDALDHAEWQAARAEVEAGLTALMPLIAHLRSATVRCQMSWFPPDLGERLRAFDIARGTAEPLGGR